MKPEGSTAENAGGRTAEDCITTTRMYAIDGSSQDRQREHLNGSHASGLSRSNHCWSVAAELPQDRIDRFQGEACSPSLTT